MRAFSQLADLELLLLRIPDETVRAYAAESVASYSAGAYRSAIVSIWIAIVYDLYQKTLHLAEQYGDAAAKSCVQEIEAIRNQQDKKQVSAWERTILENAHDEVKMLTDTEYDHLNRIQHDRHRCAHPVFDREGLLFQPSPELARSHIRTAIDTLLSQTALVGKAAIEALVRDVEGVYFPSNLEGVRNLLKGRHLPMSEKYRANLMKFSLKKVLYLDSEDNPDAEAASIRKRYAQVFYCLLEEHRETFEAIDRSSLTKIIAQTKPDCFGYLAALLYTEGSLWHSTPSFVQEQFKDFIQKEGSILQKLYVVHLMPNIERDLLQQQKAGGSSSTI